MSSEPRAGHAGAIYLSPKSAPTSYGKQSTVNEPAAGSRRHLDGTPEANGRRDSGGGDSDADDDNDDDDDELERHEGGEEADDDEELDDDVFVVEAIRTHMVDEDGSLKFQVKWEGWEAKEDLTWEPEDNLKESASEILREYFDKIGGRDKIVQDSEKAARGRKRGRRPSAAPPASKRQRKADDHPANSTPPASAPKWSPPAGSWEDEIERIDACGVEDDGQLIVYLAWKNGRFTKHDTSVIYKKCPQKMLRFYEQHTKFRPD